PSAPGEGAHRAGLGFPLVCRSNCNATANPTWCIVIVCPASFFSRWEWICPTVPTVAWTVPLASRTVMGAVCVGHCQLIEADSVIRQMGALPWVVLPFRQLAPYL